MPPKIVDYFDENVRDRFVQFVREQGGEVLSFTPMMREVQFCVQPPADADKNWLTTLFNRFEGSQYARTT